MTQLRIMIFGGVGGGSKLVRLLLFGLAFFLLSERESPASDDLILSFANDLYAQGDYYRAITEYKRFVFLNPNHEKKPAAEYGIAMAYYCGRKWEVARECFLVVRNRYPSTDWARQALYMLGKVDYSAEKYSTALDFFEQYTKSYPNDGSALSASLYVSLCFLHIGKAAEAEAIIRDLANVNPNDLKVQAAERVIKNERDLSMKSPLLAGSLSAVLPGAGQLYVGRPRDAAISCIINGAMIGFSIAAFKNDEPIAGAMIAIFESGWYAGNIYSAVNGAHKTNRNSRNRFLSQMEFQCGIMPSDDNRAMPAAGVSVRF